MMKELQHPKHQTVSTKQKKEKPKKEYVNNKDFYNALVKYRQDVKHAEENNLTLPRVPEYIGECLFKIATRLSEKGNFINYSFRNEMISDGIENCLRYLLTFNPERTTQAFSYFTETVKNAFIRRIEEEKKRMYYQYRMSERMAIEDSLYEIDMNKYDYSFIENYEETQRRKKEKIKEKKMKKVLDNS